MNKAKSAHRLRQLLFLLILTMTFEGLARKAAPGALNIPIFFIKDVIVMVMAYFVFRWPPVSSITFLWNAYKTVSLLLCPLVLLTMWDDPVLAIYGAKQYLYYPIVGFATCLAFQNQDVDKIVGFFKWCALLVIPTVLMAMLQLRLPQEHWLNCAVGGEELGQFSAAEHLRVSSTFSFVAQYCGFLEAQIYILALVWSNPKHLSLIWKIMAIALIPLYVLSCYITGSRGSVVGALVVSGAAFCLASTKLQVRSIFQMIGLLALLYITIFVVQYIYPDAFAAYLERENGELLAISGENQTRMLAPFTDWMEDSNLNVFGYGLGTMSNGADLISPYAARMRHVYSWTESDFATTLFEGGIYLVIVWYGFRAYILYKIVLLYIRDIKAPYIVPMAFCLAYTIINGVFGTLALQPPVAIWWWLGVGISLVFWWKCVAPPEVEEDEMEDTYLPPKRPARGRSRYAEALHSRK